MDGLREMMEDVVAKAQAYKESICKVERAYGIEICDSYTNVRHERVLVYSGIKKLGEISIKPFMEGRKQATVTADGFTFLQLDDEETGDFA